MKLKTFLDLKKGDYFINRYKTGSKSIWKSGKFIKLKKVGQYHRLTYKPNRFDPFYHIDKEITKSDLTDCLVRDETEVYTKEETDVLMLIS